MSYSPEDSASSTQTPDRSPVSSIHDHHTVVHSLQVATHHDLSFESDDMRTRMTIALEEHLRDHHQGMTTLFDHKLSGVESPSPKPCIVPGNALQLIDDDDEPTTLRSHTPSSVIIFDVDSHTHDDDDDEMSIDRHVIDQEPEPIPRPVLRVRFRSRVRITSGVRRHRHTIAGPTDLASATPCSSMSGSPSSSISAPLRWQPEENTSWGPLGKRISAYGWHRRSQKAANRLRYERQLQQQQQSPKLVDERAPLLRHGRRVTYVDPGLDGTLVDMERAGYLDSSEAEDTDEEERALKMAALKREEDEVFGKWPWRVFNRHWWWWHAEPVLCCCCSDDSDYEE